MGTEMKLLLQFSDVAVISNAAVAVSFTKTLHCHTHIPSPITICAADQGKKSQAKSEKSEATHERDPEINNLILKRDEKRAKLRGEMRINV